MCEGMLRCSRPDQEFKKLKRNCLLIWLDVEKLFRLKTFQHTHLYSN